MMPFGILGECSKIPNIHACSITIICLEHSSIVTLIDLLDHTTDQIDSLATPFIFLQDYKGYREGIDLIRGVIIQVCKSNIRRMIKACYMHTTGVDGMYIRGILEHTPKIPKGIIFVFSALDRNRS